MAAQLVEGRYIATEAHLLVDIHICNILGFHICNFDIIGADFGMTVPSDGQMVDIRTPRSS